MDEEWKDILGYENMYQVSNLGRIRSLPRKFHPRLLILKPRLDRYGYLQVVLSKNCILKNFTIHKLVATHFLKNNLIHKTEVNHISGDKTNNSIDNLEWVTRCENMRHRINLKKIKELL